MKHGKPASPVVGEIWRHRKHGWTARVAFAANDSVQLGRNGRRLAVPINEFRKRFERVERIETS